MNIQYIVCSCYIKDKTGNNSYTCVCVCIFLSKTFEPESGLNLLMLYIREHPSWIHIVLMMMKTLGRYTLFHCLRTHTAKDALCYCCWLWCYHDIKFACLSNYEFIYFREMLIFEFLMHFVRNCWKSALW